MSNDLYRCPTCGASLSLDQLRGTDCPYCRTAFPHHARAVEHAALVNQVMAQQLQQIAPYATPPVVGPAYGAPPPTPNAQVPPGYGMPNPYAAVDRAQRTAMRAVVIVGVVILGIALLIVGGAAAFFVLAG